MRHARAWRLMVGCGAATVVVGFIALPAAATLSMTLGRSREYAQASSGAPVFTGVCVFTADFGLNSSGDAGAVVMDPPGPVSGLGLTRIGPIAFRYREAFSTQAAMDAAYTLGTYSFVQSGGTAGPAPLTMDQTSLTNYPAAAPAFTSAGIAAMAAVDPAASTGLGITPIFALSSFSHTVEVRVAEHATGSVAWSLLYNGGSSLSTVTIPAGTLAAGTVYDIRLAEAYVNAAQVSGPPFMNENWIAATTATLTTVPGPAAAALLGASAAAGAARRRRFSNG